MKAYDYDIVIAGGGMVGMSLALMLSRQLPDSRILLAEPALAAQKIDTRSTAMAYRTRELFEALALWPEIAKYVAAVEHIHVSEQHSFGATDLNTDNVAWEALGYVVENASLITILQAALAQADNIQQTDQSISAIKPVAQGTLVGYADTSPADMLSAQLVIVADGAHSALKQQLGISNTLSDYHQTAIVCNLTLQQSHQQTAYERFSKSGPMAILPLPEASNEPHRAALVWSHPAEIIEPLLAADDKDFIAAFHAAFQYRLGEVSAVSSRALFPLQLIIAEEQYRRGVVLMGNAAHALHPLAGQGFNLSLRDCEALVNTLAQAWQQKQHLGDTALLKHYTEQRHMDQRLAIGLSDSLSKVFGERNSAVSILRGLGLSLLDLAPTAKQAFVKQAAGMR